MNEYRYSASELDAIVKCHKELDRSLIFGAALLGFAASCAVWGAAWAAGWLQ